MATKKHEFFNYIVYEKLTGRLVHVSADNINQAALRAIQTLPARHNDVRKLEVIAIDDMTTVLIKVPKPVLFDAEAYPKQ